MITGVKQNEVLLVGFEKKYGAALKQRIGKLRPNLAVCCIVDGDEALMLIHSREYDSRPSLIFLQGSLIDSFLWRIKAHPSTRQIPVLVLADSLSHSDMEQGYQLGANSMIRLPLSQLQFTDTLETILSYWFDFCKLSYGIFPGMTGS
jgi:CheY-like chemotaxis protein